MATKWLVTSGGNWSNAAGWSAGVPTATSDAAIGVAGTYTVSLSAESGQAKSLTINDLAATLSLVTSGGTAADLTIAGNLANSGGVAVDTANNSSGSTLSVDGTLFNAGTLDIGAINMAAGDVVSAAALDDTGTITLAGGAG